MEFGSFMLGHVLLREGRIDEALPQLQPVPAGDSYALARECRPDEAAKHNFCTYPSLDRDTMLDSIRNAPAFREARQTAIACRDKFAPYTKIRIP